MSIIPGAPTLDLVVGPIAPVAAVDLRKTPGLTASVGPAMLGSAGPTLLDAAVVPTDSEQKSFSP